MNIVEHGEIFQKVLNEQILEGATSGWMEENASHAIYNGESKITFPQMLNNKYAYGTFELTQYMDKRFRIDTLDTDESNFGFAAGNVAAEYQRRIVIPQIDAYRYSYLAKIAGISETYTPEKSTLLLALINQIDKVKFTTDFNTDIIITMSRPVYDKIMFFSDIPDSVKNINFKQGNLEFPVKNIYNVPIIPVPSRRMKTEYIFTNNGFEPTPSAKDINWLICPKSAPIAVSKTDNVKIITPENNQFADAWDIDYRIYHDLFVSDNKRDCIAVSISE